jgi:hypothetical protein
MGWYGTGVNGQVAYDYSSHCHDPKEKRARTMSNAGQDIIDPGYSKELMVDTLTWRISQA